MTGREGIRARGLIIIILFFCGAGIFVTQNLSDLPRLLSLCAIFAIVAGTCWIYLSRIGRKHNNLIRLLEEKSERLIEEKERSVAALREAEEARKEAEDQRIIIEQAMVIIKENQEDLIMAKNAAEEANRAKTQFLANMSHELRTPLNAIIGYSEMLREEMDERGDLDAVNDIRKIQRAGRHLLQIIDEILDVSKIEAGKMDLYLETFDLSTLITDVMFTIHPLAQKNGNTLQVKSSTQGFMRADEMRVRQILLNILSNACKFTMDGTIHFSISRELRDGEDWIHFQIQDSGIGMTHQQIQKLFHFFSQGDSSTNRRFGGTGLGLAISQRFCQMMGGEITVSSAPSSGTTFSVRLPAEVQPSRIEAVGARA